MMMIDRKTTLQCAALIALTLAAAVARIILLYAWPLPAQAGTGLLWQTFLLPLVATTLVVSLCANGRSAVAVEAQVRPAFEVGRCLSIGLCVSMLLSQGLLIVVSFDPQVPVPVVLAAGGAILLNMLIIMLSAYNRMPKLPWVDIAGSRQQLGPIYGPRYLRASARIWVVGLAAIIPSLFVLPLRAWPLIPLTFPIVLVASLVLRFYYGGKWQQQQSVTASAAEARAPRGLHDS